MKKKKTIEQEEQQEQQVEPIVVVVLFSFGFCFDSSREFLENNYSIRNTQKNSNRTLLTQSLDNVLSSNRELVEYVEPISTENLYQINDF